MIEIIHTDACTLPLPDRSIQCVVTSPPYYGLRKYEGVPDSAWGGDPSHAHEWGAVLPAIKPGQVAQTKWAGVSPAADGQRANTGAFCACRAWRGTLGNEPTPDLYVAHLVGVFREVRRVLRDDGTLWLNLGDSYSAAGAGAAGKELAYMGDDIAGRRARSTPGVAAGNLLGIPWRVAFALQADGWILRSDVVWAKRAPMPESVAGWEWRRCRVKVARGEVGRDGMNGSGQRPHGASIAEPSRTETWPERPQQEHDGHDFAPRTKWAACPGCAKCAPNDGLVLRRGSWRHTRAHEFVFMLAKSAGYFCDAEAAAEPAIHAGRIVKAHDGQEGGGRAPNRQTAGLADKDHLVGNTRNPRSVMHISSEPFAGAHFATFPTEIPRACLLASTSAGGACSRCAAPLARVAKTSTFRPTCSCGVPSTYPCVVLDPFAGSGTVGVVAEELGLDAFLCDASEAYLRDVLPARLQAARQKRGLLP